MCDTVCYFYGLQVGFRHFNNSQFDRAEFSYDITLYILVCNTLFSTNTEGFQFRESSLFAIVVCYSSKTA